MPHLPPLFLYQPLWVSFFYVNRHEPAVISELNLLFLFNNPGHDPSPSNRSRLPAPGDARASCLAAPAPPAPPLRRAVVTCQCAPLRERTRVDGPMASSGVGSARAAEDALPPAAEPPLPEPKPLPPAQPPPPVAAPQPPPAPQPRPQSPGGMKEEENYSFLPLVHNIIKW